MDTKERKKQSLKKWKENNRERYLQSKREYAKRKRAGMPPSIPKMITIDKLPCVESLIEFTEGDTTFRMWINKNSLLDGKSNERKSEVSQFRYYYKTYGSEGDLGTTVAWAKSLIKDLNAIQINKQSVEGIKEGIRESVVAYLVDFSDSHG